MKDCAQKPASLAGLFWIVRSACFCFKVEEQMERWNVSLEKAQKDLEDTAKIKVKDLTSPDHVSEACNQMYSFVWSVLPSVNKYEDGEIDEIVGVSRSFDKHGEIAWIVSDVAFAGEGAICLLQSSVANYISQYKSLVGLGFFDGDVIVWSTDQLWLIHHEYVYTRIVFSKKA